MRIQKKGIITILGFCLLFFAQEAKADLNIVEQINQSSENTIQVEIPQNILDQLMKPNQKKESSEGKPGINKTTGYRIQVFSDGRNQNTLEARAKSRGNIILSKFPKYKGQIYTYSSSPNWYTRIGNFKTQSEANVALTELKKAFPSFANEMRIVKSQIVVVK